MGRDASKGHARGATFLEISPRCGFHAKICESTIRRRHCRVRDHRQVSPETFGKLEIRAFGGSGSKYLASRDLRTAFRHGSAKSCDRRGSRTREKILLGRRSVIFEWHSGRCAQNSRSLSLKHQASISPSKTRTADPLTFGVRRPRSAIIST